MEGENKKYVRICTLCKKEFESRTRSEYCDKCRKWLYTKHYNEYPSHNYEQYLHDECPQRMGNTRGTMNCPDDDAIRRAEKKVFKQRLKELETTLADLDETIEQLNGLKIGDTTYYFLFEHNTEQLIFIDLYINGNGGNNPINISYGNTHIIPEKILSHPYEQFMGERYSEILNSVTRAENKMQRRFPSIHTTSGFTVTPGTAYVEGVDSNIGLLQIDDYGEHSKREYILTPTAIKIIDDENKSWKEYPL